MARDKQKQKEWKRRNSERINKHRREVYAINSKDPLIIKKKNDNQKRHYNKVKNTKKYIENRRVKQRKESYKKWRSEYRKYKRETDHRFKIDANISSRISTSLKGSKNGIGWEKLVGYTKDDLIKHLEKQFDKNMSWDNYGSYWHVDHNIPLSWFRYNSSKDKSFKVCWGLTNLQPLTATENIKKGNRYSG